MNYVSLYDSENQLLLRALEEEFAAKEKSAKVAAAIAAAKTVYASGCTALTELDLPAAKTVYASGCTALTELDLPAAETVDARGCTALTELDLPAAKTVDARGCTALTELDLPAAKTVDARGCTALTELDLPAAKTVDARGCTALTELDLPAAKTVYASGCTALTEWCAKYQEPGGRMEKFLTGGGKSLEVVCAPEHWECHNWGNCPTHAAYGTDSIDGLPEEVRNEAAIFIGLFDSRLLRNPLERIGATA
ncbi:MAG: hypothetical protein WDO73_25250 [Ignavibacteriota bacterium]